MASIITEETIAILTKEFEGWMKSEFSQMIMLHINERVYGLQQQERGTDHIFDVKLQTQIDCYKSMLQIPYEVFRKQLNKYRTIIEARKGLDKEKKEPKSPL